MNILRHVRRAKAQGPAKKPARIASAPHLTGDRDRVIDFRDIAALPEPEWATHPAPQPFQPGRYEWEALVPVGQLAAVALDGDDLLARLDAVAAVWFDAQFDDDTESEADR